MTEAEQIAIAQEYYDSIDKPQAARQKPQFSLCLIGLVGSGKSTVLKKLCQLIPMARESGDEVRKLIHDKGLPPTDSHTLADIGERVVYRLHTEGYRVAYDNDFGNPLIRKDMEEYNRASGIPIIWIRVAPPEHFIKDKLTAYEHTYLFRDADDALATYHKRKALHESDAAAIASLPYVYTFDTSAPNLDQQILEAASLIQTRLRALQTV